MVACLKMDNANQASHFIACFNNISLGKHSDDI